MSFELTDDGMQDFQHCDFFVPYQFNINYKQNIVCDSSVFTELSREREAEDILADDQTNIVKVGPPNIFKDGQCMMSQDVELLVPTNVEPLISKVEQCAVPTYVVDISSKPKSTKLVIKPKRKIKPSRKQYRKPIIYAKYISKDKIKQINTNNVDYICEKNIVYKIRIIEIIFKNKIQKYVHLADLGGAVILKSNIVRLVNHFSTPEQKIRIYVDRSNYNNVRGHRASVLSLNGVISFIKLQLIAKHTHFVNWINETIIPLLTN